MPNNAIANSHFPAFSREHVRELKENSSWPSLISAMIWKCCIATCHFCDVAHEAIAELKPMRLVVPNGDDEYNKEIASCQPCVPICSQALMALLWHTSEYCCRCVSFRRIMDLSQPSSFAPTNALRPNASALSWSCSAILADARANIQELPFAVALSMALWITLSERMLRPWQKSKSFTARSHWFAFSNTLVATLSTWTSTLRCEYVALSRQEMEAFQV